MVAAVLPLTAQDTGEPSAFLVYYDDDFELEVFDSSGEYLGEVFMGMELFPGSTIKTYNTTAEIQLDPNGSVMKISENSVFQIEAFQTAADESNDFTLFSGKLRVIAARAGLGYENYSIVTESAVCGVRGTDFVIDSIGVLAVLDGEVAFSSTLNGDTISVMSGQIADVFADSFQAVAATAQSLSSIFSGMDFKGTDPTQVPGHNPSTELKPDDSEDGDKQDADEGGNEDQDGGEKVGSGDADEGGDDKAAPDTAKSGSAAGAITGRSRPDNTAQKDDETEEPAAPAEPGPFDDFFKAVGDLVNLEIGSVNIDNKTYAKAVFQPEFEIGDLSLGLYIPIIYQNDLFDPNTWYWPAGNNEYSFGFDKTTPEDFVLDMLGDIFLKIRYIQLGDNGDDFYLKFGNLDNMSIGHGILMYNYTNNLEFPAVRKVGLNTGINFEYFGFEAVVDDASDPSIFGGRLVYIPFGQGFPLGIGASAITDINPDSMTETTETVLFNPMIINGAVDLGLPVDLLGLTVFAQAAGMLPYINDRWWPEALYNDTGDFLTSLNNYGVSAGIYGELFSFIDYRLEYQLSKGIFRPSFYNAGYNQNKNLYYEEIVAYTQNLSAAEYQAVTMGVYGELSMNLFDAVILEGGYKWPWEINGTTVNTDVDDYFFLTLEIMPDVIPIAGLYGSVTYARTGLVGDIVDAASGTAFTLIDSTTILNGELVYPFDQALEIALQFSTVISRDSNGVIQMTAGVPDYYFAMSIDTRLNF